MNTHTKLESPGLGSCQGNGGFQQFAQWDHNQHQQQKVWKDTVSTGIHEPKVFSTLSLVHGPRCFPSLGPVPSQAPPEMHPRGSAVGNAALVSGGASNMKLIQRQNKHANQFAVTTAKTICFCASLLLPCSRSLPPGWVAVAGRRPGDAAECRPVDLGRGELTHSQSPKSSVRRSVDSCLLS